MARCICVAYNGKWTKDNKYVDHETKLVLINDEITFEGLVEKIFQVLKLKKEEIETKIWFDTKLDTSKGMLVTNDEEITTCIHLLKNDANFKTSRFIVDIAERKSLPANSSKTELSKSIVHEEVNIVPQEDGLWEMHVEKDEALIIDDETFLVVEPTMQPDYPTTKEIAEETGQTSNVKKDEALMADEAVIVVEPTMQSEHPTTKEITEETGQTSSVKKVRKRSISKRDDSPTVVMREDASLDEITEEMGQTSNIKKVRRRSIIRRDVAPTVVLGEDASLDEIDVGSIFEDRESLKKCFLNFAAEYHFKFKVHKGAKRQYYLKCWDDECNWHVHSSRVRDSSLFRITQFERNHTCALYVLPDQPQVTSEVVSEHIIEFLRDTKADIKPKFVVDEIEKKYGVTISRHKAWRAIQLALGMIRGSAKKNSELCSSCLHLPDGSNPVTPTKNIQKDDQTQT